MADYMDLGIDRDDAVRDFESLQKRFKKNFGYLSEEELKIFRAKVSELLDLLRDKKRRDY